MTGDQDEGRLDPATAEHLEQMRRQHHRDRKELADALEFRNDTIAETSRRMRGNAATEEQITRLVDDALDPEVPFGLWIDAMHGDLDDELPPE